MLGIAKESLNTAKGGGSFGFKSGEILFNIKRLDKGKVEVQKYDGTKGECPLFYIKYPLKVSLKLVGVANEDYKARNQGYLSFKKGTGIFLEPETISNKYWLRGIYEGKKGKLPKFSIKFERAIVAGNKVFVRSEVDHLTKNLKIDLTERLNLTPIYQKTKTKQQTESTKAKKTKKKKKKKKKIKKSKIAKREEKKKKQLAAKKLKLKKQNEGSNEEGSSTKDLSSRNKLKGKKSKVRRWFNKRSATITSLEKFRDQMEKESELQMKGLPKLDPKLVSAVIMEDNMHVLKKLCRVDKRIRQGNKLSDLIAQLFQLKKKLPSLLGLIVNNEVNNSKNQQTILRSPMFTGSLASSVVKISGGEYFRSVSKSLFQALLKHPKDYQVDPRYVGDKPAKITKNQQNLTKVLSEFLKTIYESQKHFPKTLHHLCFLVKHKLQDEFPNYNYRTVIGSFLFLRYFSPSITNPTIFKIVKKTPSTDCNRALVQIAKVLQIIANDSKFGTLSHLAILNEFAIQQNEKLGGFIEKISDNKFSSKKEDTIFANNNKISQIEKEIARIININMIFIAEEFDKAKDSLQKK
ncbi:ras gtpase-activating protein [Anaeramoeba flamelloides]|uniref:Ras gtpase-activating protein n=1 Tax=Anaeramoeba flamelloides TaxID=1746091 RepID=A0ABQ8ZG73_9EUKA|nr:ras gtpase-activating protein [Anaeramoeba flamelloides]